MPKDRVNYYIAGGGVVVNNDCVLVLRRPSRNDEVRLPKGHVEAGETIQEAALRETAEESGYTDLEIQGDLGEQEVEFDFRDKHVVRLERYFVMQLGPACLLDDGSAADPLNPETQFTPEWLSWEEALLLLSYEPEREWVRRARMFLDEADTR